MLTSGRMSEDGVLTVLIVDDEPLIAEAHQAYVERIPGFRVVGVAHSGQEALAAARTGPVELILLDFNLPDLHGLEVCRLLRAAGVESDVLAVTSNRDLAAVRAAVSLGIVSYLLKPFSFRAFRERLERYAEYRRQLDGSPTLSAQSEVDRALATLRGSPEQTLPTGLSLETLELVARYVQTHAPQSAAEVATGCEVSRVTARRYLEHLAQTGTVQRKQRHGGSGRPEIEYGRTLPT
jgi:response regulator of citrate/malate metabolism